jgi:hypothetical protein
MAKSYPVEYRMRAIALVPPGKSKEQAELACPRGRICELDTQNDIIGQDRKAN